MHSPTGRLAFLTKLTIYIWLSCLLLASVGSTTLISFAHTLQTYTISFSEDGALLR